MEIERVGLTENCRHQQITITKFSPYEGVCDLCGEVFDERKLVQMIAEKIKERW